MLSNRTIEVAPIIGLLRLTSDEKFLAADVEKYTYECIGGNHTRIALQQLLGENEDVSRDPMFTHRNVSVYVNLTDEQSQHLAHRHNRATEFVNKMTTQDKVCCQTILVLKYAIPVNVQVHLCRMRLYTLAGKTCLSEDTPLKTQEWRISCAATLMMSVSVLFNFHR